jgi:hypothetical protein
MPRGRRRGGENEPLGLCPLITPCRRGNLDHEGCRFRVSRPESQGLRGRDPTVMSASRSSSRRPTAWAEHANPRRATRPAPGPHCPRAVAVCYRTGEDVLRRCADVGSWTSLTARIGRIEPATTDATTNGQTGTSLDLGALRAIWGISLGRLFDPPRPTRRPQAGDQKRHIRTGTRTPVNDRPGQAAWVIHPSDREWVRIGPRQSLSGPRRPAHRSPATTGAC